jgi:voltage-gated potassium channel
MDNLFAFPSRNLIRVTLFMLVVAALATAGYMEAGWNIQDSLYMVTLTVFTVGYGEVHPIDTPYLHALTMATMVFGCTGIIFFTGALVQFFTLSPLQQILGVRRVHTEIDKLTGHVIICGFGRIGVALAKALKDGGAAFVVLEQARGGWRKRGTQAFYASRRTPQARKRCRTQASTAPASWPRSSPTTQPTSSSP